MDQPIRDGDHKIIGGTASTLIGCILVVVIYATTAMLSSKKIQILETGTRISNQLRNINSVGRGSRDFIAT